jgi:hypothetical protein
MDQHYHNLAKIDNSSKIDKNGRHLSKPQTAMPQTPSGKTSNPKLAMPTLKNANIKTSIARDRLNSSLKARLRNPEIGG